MLGVLRRLEQLGVAQLDDLLHGEADLADVEAAVETGLLRIKGNLRNGVEGFYFLTRRGARFLKAATRSVAAS